MPRPTTSPPSEFSRDEKRRRPLVTESNLLLVRTSLPPLVQAESPPLPPTSASLSTRRDRSPAPIRPVLVPPQNPRHLVPKRRRPSLVVSSPVSPRAERSKGLRHPRPRVSSEIRHPLFLSTSTRPHPRFPRAPSSPAPAPRRIHNGSSLTHCPADD